MSIVLTAIYQAVYHRIMPFICRGAHCASKRYNNHQIMLTRGKSPYFVVTDIADDFFDTRKPWTNFAISEISVEKAILIMNLNFILGFLGPPLQQSP